MYILNRANECLAEKPAWVCYLHPEDAKDEEEEGTANENDVPNGWK